MEKATAESVGVRLKILVLCEMHALIDSCLCACCRNWDLSKIKWMSLQTQINNFRLVSVPVGFSGKGCIIYHFLIIFWAPFSVLCICMYVRYNGVQVYARTARKDQRRTLGHYWVNKLPVVVGNGIELTHWAPFFFISIRYGGWLLNKKKILKPQCDIEPILYLRLGNWNFVVCLTSMNPPSKHDSYIQANKGTLGSLRRKVA